MELPQQAIRTLERWFGDLDDAGFCDQEHTKRWFMKDDAFDESLREEFGGLYAAIIAGECENWLDDPRSALAYVIVLDQFSRNMFRGSGQMYDGDERALKAVYRVLESGADRTLRPAERTFLYMPLMHSERLADQDRCIAEFRSLVEDVPEANRSAVEMNVDYAEKHRAIVARFGRFPHRNELVGRPSTDEELAFLQEPGSSF